MYKEKNDSNNEDNEDNEDNEEINFKDLIFRTFQKKKIDRIVYQPRIMLWYNGNYVGYKSPPKEKYSPLKIPIKEREKNVPKDWFGKTPVEIHKEINSSIRYTAETMGINYFFRVRDKDAKISIKITTDEHGATLRKITTPVGSVSEKHSYGYKIEKMVKTEEDIKVAKYLVEHESFFYNSFMYEAAVEELGNIGVPQCYYWRSPYQACVLEYLGFERTTIWLRRKKRLMEDFLQFLEEHDKKNYKVIINSDLQFLNFGENIDVNLCPPPQFEKYLIPFYEERVKWLKNAPIPKFTHIHIDGHCKDLLPYLADLPFDGIEALTPYPQGDVSLEELRDHIGEKILLDGIPATLFMHQFPEKRLIDCVEKVLEYFSPNLILGISDELPGNTDGKRLKIIGNLLKKYEL
ncbi:MAG: uroporphyrinogen decarboxylase family protein [Promethearchaeota archaeon]